MATASNLPAERTQRTASPIVVLRENLSAMAPELRMALPAHVTVEKFSRVAMTAIQNNPDLLNADRKSLFGAIVRLAQDGLLPDGREAALVMFGNKVQAMPMIAGVLKKIRQSGDVAKVSAQVVYANDEFVWTLGFDETVTHNPPALDQDRGKPIGAYATAVLKDGSQLLEVMSLQEIEQVRNVSRAKNNGPWVSWWGEMARKTVMRRLSKRLPMSTDLQDEIERDPTLADEPAEIEHAPQPISRLDALEQHFELEEPPQPAADEPANPVEAEPEPEGAAPSASKPSLAKGSQATTMFERMSNVSKGGIAGQEPEGRPGADMGEPLSDQALADQLVTEARDQPDLPALATWETEMEPRYATLTDDLKIDVDAEIAAVRRGLAGGE